MDIQSRGPVGWVPRDIPPPGTLTLLTRDTEGDYLVTGRIPPPYGTEPPIRQSLDACLPLIVADAVRDLINGAVSPGDSISGQISGGSLENEIRLTVNRLSDGNIALLWGDLIPSGGGVSPESLHQTTGDLPDMLSRHDHEFIFSSATPSSYSLFGYRPSELNGTSLLMYIHPEDVSRVESCYLPLVTIPGVCRIRYRLKNIKGEYRWVESVFSSTFRADGSFCVILASTREMDAIVRAEQAVRGANAKLNLLNGIIRHDMMNQITGMIGYLDILSEMVDGEDIRLLITKEQEIIARVRRLIDLTRDYQGIGLHPPGFIDVDAVIYKILARHEFTGRLEAHRSLDGLFVYVDRMFEQVIFEMVANSLAYGGENVAIRFSFEITDEGLIIVMEDNGPGIESHEKEHIFSRNYQNRRGYGLYLATEILDITGIRIREVGEPGAGARFELIVPHDGYRITPGACES